MNKPLLLSVMLTLASIIAPITAVGAESAPRSGKLYVTSWFGNALSVIDLEQGRVVKTIPVGVHDHNVFLSPDRTEAWVANNNDGTVSVIDTRSDTVIATLSPGMGPRHTFFSPDGANAYITLEFDDAVAVIDPQTRDIKKVMPVGHMPHFPIVVGDRLYVTNFGGASVSVLDRESGAELAMIPVGTGPLGGSVTRDGKLVLIASHNANQVAIIATDSLAVEAVISTDAGPVQVSVTPDQRFAWVANDGVGSVQKIDLLSKTVVKTVALGQGAGSHGIGFAGDQNLMFITNTGRASVSIVDLTNDEVIAEIPVGPTPEGIAYLPK